MPAKHRSPPIFEKFLDGTILLAQELYLLDVPNMCAIARIKSEESAQAREHDV